MFPPSITIKVAKKLNENKLEMIADAGNANNTPKNNNDTITGIPMSRNTANTEAGVIFFFFDARSQFKISHATLFGAFKHMFFSTQVVVELNTTNLFKKECVGNLTEVI